jgi:hypothetical protein
MNSELDKKTSSARSAGLSKKSLPHLSLGLHTMPKTETGHFQKWLVLGLAIFVLIILTIVFIIN